MNRALLNPFVSADLPKGIEEIMDKEKATCVAFNRHGNLLAVGTSSAHVSLWDFDTRSVAAKLTTSRDQRLSVSCVSFPAPRNGSLVLVSYAPGTVRIFDTLSQEMISEVVFDVPIVQAVAHPKIPGVVIAIPRSSHPLILHMRKGIYHVRCELFRDVRDPDTLLKAPASKEQFSCGEANIHHDHPRRPRNSFGNKVFGYVPPRSDSINFSVLCDKDDFDQSGVAKEASGSRKRSYCVAFTRAGDILRGGPSGLIRTFVLQDGGDKNKGPDDQIRTATCVSVVCIQGRAAIRGITLSRKSEEVLVNSHDRSMRLFRRDQVVNPDGDRGTENAENSANGLQGKTRAISLRTIEPVTTFTEIVNKTQCRCACFSSDGDYVLGGMEGTEHKIHIWRTVDGHLELTLEGAARGGVAQIQWHPLRGVITSVGLGTGEVYVWAKNVTENWSAFATEFSELEANEEYSESETEFDKKEPQDESEVKRAREAAEAATVDVETCNGGAWFSSDSEKDDTYFYIPAKPVRDVIDYPPSLADDLILAKVGEKRDGEEEGSDEVVLVSEDVNDDTRRRRKRSGEHLRGRGSGKRGRGKRQRSAGGDSSGVERWRDDRETGDEGSDNPNRRREVPVVNLEEEEHVGPRGSEEEDQEVQVVENVTVDISTDGN